MTDADEVVRVLCDRLTDLGATPWAIQCRVRCELERRAGRPPHGWIEQLGSYKTVRCAAGGKQTLEEAGLNPTPDDFNVGLVCFSSGPVVLDIDTTNWRNELDRLFQAAVDLEGRDHYGGSGRPHTQEAKKRVPGDEYIVLTPRGGAHVYLRVKLECNGRWKHSTLPMTLLASGHVLLPGSEVAGHIYEPLDPSMRVLFSGCPSWKHSLGHVLPRLFTGAKLAEHQS